MKIYLYGECLHLLASGAAYVPSCGMLLLADVHFGKASSFRQLGVPVPSGTTQETLDAISQDMASTQAQHLIFLGDFLHSHHAHAAATQDKLLAWRHQHTGVRITLVRGNHDDRARDPALALGIEVVDEPLAAGALALCHHPQTVRHRYVLAGHLHPCIIVHGKARERLRLPCFWMGCETTQPIGVLPAYGSFTGMHPIKRRTADKVYAIAGDALRAL